MQNVIYGDKKNNKNKKKERKKGQILEFWKLHVWINTRIMPHNFGSCQLLITVSISYLIIHANCQLSEPPLRKSAILLRCYY